MSFGRPKSVKVFSLLFLFSVANFTVFKDSIMADGLPPQYEENVSYVLFYPSLSLEHLFLICSFFCVRIENAKSRTKEESCIKPKSS